MNSENVLANIDLDKLHGTCDLILNDKWVPESRSGKTTAMLYLMLGQVYLAQDGFQFLYVTDRRQMANSYESFLTMLAENKIPHCIDPNDTFVRTWSHCQLDWYGNREYVGVPPWKWGHTFWFLDFSEIQRTILPSYRFASIFIDVDHYWMKVGQELIDSLQKNVVDPRHDIYMG